MKEALQRAIAQKAAAKAKPTAPAKTTAAPTPAPAATRSWGAADPGHEYRMPAPAAPAPKQSALNKRMVALLAQQAKPTYR